MPKRVCPVPGCPNLTSAGRCASCRRANDTDRRPDGNPYNTAGHLAFREDVLTRDPVCTCDDLTCPQHVGRRCLALSTVADHHPVERRDLVAAGLDPNDPDAGRGLCKGCHDRHTARTSPGGWARNGR